MKYLIVLFVLMPLTLSGCFEDRFRYACQDSSNWDSPSCQKPQCAINQTCPEHVMKVEDMKGDVR
jgi:cobalamin biosynthesis protein CobD/CbiB